MGLDGYRVFRPTIVKAPFVQVVETTRHFQNVVRFVFGVEVSSVVDSAARWEEITFELEKCRNVCGSVVATIGQAIVVGIQCRR